MVQQHFEVHGYANQYDESTNRIIGDIGLISSAIMGQVTLNAADQWLYCCLAPAELFQKLASHGQRGKGKIDLCGTHSIEGVCQLEETKEESSCS